MLRASIVEIKDKRHMKKILLFSICNYTLSCNNIKSSKQDLPISDSLNVTKQTVSRDTNSISTPIKNYKKEESKNDLKDKILGTWALIGIEDASFVIEKKKINYPETFTSYKYSIDQDSIKIKYDDYVGSYLIKFRGEDTLVLIGDEEQVYYRIKK